MRLIKTQPHCPQCGNFYALSRVKQAWYMRPLLWMGSRLLHCNVCRIQFRQRKWSLQKEKKQAV